MIPAYPNRIRRRAARCLTGAILVAMVGCAGCGAMSYSGQVANPESATPLLQGDVRQLNWQTIDLLINATYALSPGQLDLAGQVELQPRLAHYPVLGYLSVDVHALDGEGIILASYPLWSAPARRELFFVDWSFQRHYAVPDGTRALTFSYRGQMRDGGGGKGRLQERDDGSVIWDFWRTP